VPTTSPGSFAARVRDLAGERGLTKLKHAAYRPDVRGTSIGAFDSALLGRAEPPVALMESVARVLQVDPLEFDEYRLHLARQRLDPSIVGLRSALASADLLLSQPIPEEIAEKAARQREATPPGESPSEQQRKRRGRAA
jgi:hypothetical protein